MMIEVENLSKLYKLGSIGSTTLRESLNRAWYRMIGKEELGRRIGEKDLMIPPDHPQAGPEPNTFWALKDVSFTVEQGDIVGVIGRNGAGKSTLLKVLTRITEPTSGRAVLRGRVGSLLEVGTGFHPELTGRENIYLNGAILGMRRREIERKFDEIVAFAEVERFIDTPVKRYSSGMYVRLAFAVAAHLDPEILLVDEVLAVGDAAFQKKCLGKMKDVAGEGRTVLFVSHNLASVRSLCRTGILLRDGMLALRGTTDDVVDAYLHSHEVRSHVSLAELSERQGRGDVRITALSASCPGAAEAAALTAGQPALFRFDMSPALPGYYELTFTIYGRYGHALANFRTTSQGAHAPVASLVCRVNQLNLVPGRYHVNVGLADSYGLEDHIECALYFDVIPGVGPHARVASDGRYGAVYFLHEWLANADEGLVCSAP